MHFLCCVDIQDRPGMESKCFRSLFRQPHSCDQQRWGAATPITIDVPSAPPFNAMLTDTFAINPAGAIVGLYMDSSFIFHATWRCRRSKGTSRQSRHVSGCYHPGFTAIAP